LVSNCATRTKFDLDAFEIHGVNAPEELSEVASKRTLKKKPASEVQLVRAKQKEGYNERNCIIQGRGVKPWSCFQAAG
jgi:hypothetical protein